MYPIATRDNHYLVALGSNLTTTLGNPQTVIQKAIHKLGGLEGRLTAVSRFFETPAFPKGAGPDYINAAVAMQSGLSPETFLAELHKLESDFDRKRAARWDSRTLDLDLIAAGNIVRPDPDTHQHWRTLSLDQQQRSTPDALILPHPRLQDRAFVLGPLRDIAPAWRHPLLNKSVSELFDALCLESRNELRPLSKTACQAAC